MAPKKKSTMSDSHKAALAEGRSESRSVKNYLEALEENRPKRGRKRTTESINKRLEQIEKELPTTGPLKRVSLIQERMNLTKELNAGDSTIDISEFEDAFVSVAQGYSERKKISYAAWRELGVPASVLSKAGISRSA
jgi:hypothetical protein